MCWLSLLIAWSKTLCPDTSGDDVEIGGCIVDRLQPSPIAFGPPRLGSL